MERLNKLKICLQENQMIVPSYSLYGGLSGFQDYGILGTYIKNRLVELWREFFVNSNIFEIDTPLITKFKILESSGHVDRFTDFIVTDKFGKEYRADHLVKKYFEKKGMVEMLDKVDGWPRRKIELVINQYKMLEPIVENNKIVPFKVEEKNLMYMVTASSKDNENKIDFLRPELAQGIFINYNKVKKFLNVEPPFGIAQVGKSFRKEITATPFLRLKEFNQAEIEYFIDPLDPYSNSVKDISNYTLPILSAKMQNSGDKVKMFTVDSLIKSKTVNNCIVGHFLVKIHKFAKMVGLKEHKMRFRQHLSNELAHYALDCWDLEVFIGNKWIECVGCANRGSYDLEIHSKNGNGKKLVGKRQLKVPLKEKHYNVVTKGKVIAKRYRELTKDIITYYKNLEQNQLKDVKINMEKKGQEYIYINNLMCIITKDMVKVEEQIKIRNHEEYYPYVIEPSFGIDRLMYAIFEHSFWARQNDQNRVVLSLPNRLVPYTVAILPLHKKQNMINIVNKIETLLNQNSIRNYVDLSSVSIGRKYSRVDEMGIRYAITIDPGSLTDNQVTIRERDSMKQIRVDIDQVINNLTN